MTFRDGAVRTMSFAIDAEAALLVARWRLL
jgi:hypothetical protein